MTLSSEFWNLFIIFLPWKQKVNRKYFFFLFIYLSTLGEKHKKSFEIPFDTIGIVLKFGLYHSTQVCTDKTVLAFLGTNNSILSVRFNGPTLEPTVKVAAVNQVTVTPVLSKENSSFPQSLLRKILLQLEKTCVKRKFWKLTR